MEQTQGQTSKSKMNGNKSLAAANMEMTPESIQSYVQDAISEAKAMFTERTGAIRDYSQEKYEASVDYVKANPVKSTLGAVGIGFLVGAAFTALIRSSSSK